MIDLSLLQAIVDAGATGAVVLAAVRHMETQSEFGSVRNQADAASSLPAGVAGPNTDANAGGGAQSPAPIASTSCMREFSERLNEGNAAATTPAPTTTTDRVRRFRERLNEGNAPTLIRLIDTKIDKERGMIDPRASAQTLIEEAKRLCGHRLKHEDALAGWLDQGIAPQTIANAMREAVARKRDGPPASWRYFRWEVPKAHARAGQPYLPVAPAIVARSEGINVRPTTYQASRDAWREAGAELDAYLARACGGSGV